MATPTQDTSAGREAGAARRATDEPVTGVIPGLWWGLLLAVVASSVAYGVFMHTAPSSRTFVLWVGDLGQLFTAAAATAATAWRARQSTGRTRAGWTWLSIAVGSWAVGQLLWCWYELGLGDEVPFPSAADLFYLLAVPAMAVGVLRLTGATSRLSETRVAFDGLVIAGSLLFMSWAAVLGPAYRDTDASNVEWAVLLAYPIGDVAIATVALVALTQVRGARRRPVLMISLAMLCLALADSGFARLVEEGNYGTGAWIDAGWFAGFLLFVLAALWPAPADYPAEAPGALTTGQMLLPYLPLAAAAGTALGLSTSDEPIDRALIVLGALLAVLVLVRQLITLLENRRLTHDLELVVEELREREGELEHEATHDRLTGLANRGLFTDRLSRAIDEQQSCAVLLCDLDGFKAVNDTIGHLAGDKVLQVAARRMEASVRGGDTVARFGGDEFAVLLEDIDDPSRAVDSAERIVARVAEPIMFDGHDGVYVGVSVGVMIVDEVVALENYDADQLLRRADAALYRAKDAGKNTFQVFESHMLVDEATDAADATPATDGTMVDTADAALT